MDRPMNEYEGALLGAVIILIKRSFPPAKIGKP
jgi:hypothetical protein